MIDGDAAISSVFAGDQAQAVLLLIVADGALFVAGLEAFLIGRDPDLQQAHLFVWRRIELAVADSCACGHALNFAAADDRAGAEAVFVFQRPAHHVGDDFHVAVWVHAEAAAGKDDVVVDHAQRAEAHPVGIVVIAERE